MKHALYVLAVTLTIATGTACNNANPTVPTLAASAGSIAGTWTQPVNLQTAASDGHWVRVRFDTRGTFTDYFVAGNTLVAHRGTYRTIGPTTIAIVQDGQTWNYRYVVTGKELQLELVPTNEQRSTAAALFGTNAAGATLNESYRRS